MPTSNASTSTMNWREGWGRMSTGAEVNRLLRTENASLASRGPGEGTKGRGESGQWGRDPAEASDKAAVHLSEPKEPPKLGAVSGSRPLLHHLHLLLGSDLPLLQDVPEELHGGRVEHALLGLDEEPVLQQLLQDQTNVMLVLFGGLAEA